MTAITSLQNQRVKDAVRLRDGRHRQRQGRILIDGARELTRAIESGIRLLEVFTCEPLATSDECRRVAEMLPDSGAELLPVSRPVFEKLAFGSRAEGVLGVGETPDASLSKLTLPDRPLVVVLEGVEKPGNVGAVVRSADAAGASAVVVADGRTDLYNPNAIRASLGTIFTMPVAAATSEETLAWLADNQLAIYAARVDGSLDYTEADLRRPAAVVLGSEAAGLSDTWSTPQVTSIRLPMRGSADSLNVSTTAAVLLYEALRQRGRRNQ